MAVNGINGTNTPMGQTGMNQTTDSYSRNIQKQIANAQKQLQELSSNEELTLEEKMKKRQEIQQQISDLNMQLRQHQMEQRKEKQQAKASSMDDMLGGTKAKAEEKNTGLSQSSMTAMISADASVKQAKVQGNAATKMEGRANVLKAEIKQGGNTEAKQKELAELEQKAMEATASQMNTLAKADKAVKEAAAAEHNDNKASGAKEEKTAQTENTTEKATESSTNKENAQPVETAVSEVPSAQTAAYTHVDVRL